MALLRYAHFADTKRVDRDCPVRLLLGALSYFAGTPRDYSRNHVDFSNWTFRGHLLSWENVFVVVPWRRNPNIYCLRGDRVCRPSRR